MPWCPWHCPHWGHLCSANAVDSMAVQAIRSARVFGFQQQLAVRAVLVLRQLVGGQGGIKPVHERRVGMAAGAEREYPAAILVTASAGPFLNEGMFQLVVGRVPAVATGTGQSAPQMNVINQVAEVQVCGSAGRCRRKGKKRFGFL